MTRRPSAPFGTVCTRLILRVQAVLLVGLFLLAPAAPSAYGHAQLLRTTPADSAVLDAAPAQVDLEFSEPVSLVDGAIRLFPTGAEPITLSATTDGVVVTIPLPASLADGVYTVSYRVVSADGHPVSGALSFRIGQGHVPTTPAGEFQQTPSGTEILVIALTGLQYLGLLLAVGLLLFHRLVLRRAQPAPTRPLRWSLGITLTASVLLIPASAVRVAGGQPWEILWPPAWASTFSWQLGLVAALIGGACLAAWLTSERPDWLGRLTVPLALVALAGPLLVGHSQTTSPTWLMLVADLGHLAASAFWFGGLFGLLQHLHRTLRQPPDQPTVRALAHIVSRFSGFALGSVLLLAASGVTMGVLLLGSLDALPGTSYGRTLLLKLGIVVPVLGLAAWNRFILLPRLITEPTNRPHWDTLTRTLRNESALLIAVIAVTGLLTNTSPGHAGHDQGRPSRPTTVALEATSQGLQIGGTVTPATTGTNQLSFNLSYQGQPLTTDQVTLAARLPAQELGPLQTTPVLDPATGRYTATLTLPAAGQWQLQLSVRVDTFTKPVVLVDILIE